MKTLKTVIISGSVRNGRLSHRVAKELHKRFTEAGYANTSLLDIAEYNFPVAEERYGKLASPPEKLEQAQKLLFHADAMVFVSPEYHGSFSGALKNFLDYFWVEFSRKPIGVASVSTGRFGGINASSEMQQLVLSIGGFAMPHKLVVPSVHQAFDSSGAVTDEFLNKNLNKFIAEFLWFSEAIAEKKLQTNQVSA